MNWHMYLLNMLGPIQKFDSVDINWYIYLINRQELNEIFILLACSNITRLNYLETKDNKLTYISYLGKK